MFSSKATSSIETKEWLREDKLAPNGLARAIGRHRGDPDDWKVQRGDIKKAIERASRSATGPDGIPYEAWKRLGGLATDVLWEATQLLESQEGAEALARSSPQNAERISEFNEAIMVFIPKKDPLLAGNGVEYHKAADLRTLSIEHRQQAHGQRSPHQN